MLAALMSRLLAVLFGHEAGDQARVRAAVLAASFGAVSNHVLADIRSAGRVTQIDRVFE